VPFEDGGTRDSARDGGKDRVGRNHDSAMVDLTQDVEVRLDGGKASRGGKRGPMFTLRAY